MSFGESVFSARFIQKTVKVDLDVRINRAYSRRKQLQKVPEGSREHHTEAEGEMAPGGAGQPLLRMSVHHRLLGCIYAIHSSQFDPRAQDWGFSLYILAPTTPLR